MKKINTLSNFDHSITILTIILTIINFSAFQLRAQEGGKKDDTASTLQNSLKPSAPQAVTDEIKFNNETGNAIITITDEGSNKGSITLPEMSTAPTPTTDKLYNLNGTINFDGAVLGSGGAAQIDDLTDAKYEGSSLFMGNNAGFNDDGTSISSNTAVGEGALYSNINSGANTAIGTNAIQSLTGSGNTAVGNFTMTGSGATRNASANTAVGKSALRFIDEGSENAAFGHSALSSNLNGEKNTAIGTFAFRFGAEGSYNVSLGHSADQFNNGSNNTVIGYQAGYVGTTNTKSGNIFLGYRSGYSETGNDKLYIENSNSTAPLIWGDFANDDVKINGDFHVTGNIPSDGSSPGVSEIDDLTDAKTGGNSIFLGAGAGTNDDASDNKNYSFGLNSLFSTNTGFSNASIGFNSLYFNTSGNYNIGFGQGSLYYNNTGSANVAVGYHSNHHNQTGSNNTILGHEAGRGSTTHNKSGNVFIGYQAGYNETNDNKLYIENSSSSNPLIGGDFSTNEVKINGNLDVTGNISNNGIAVQDDWDALGSELNLFNPSSLKVGIGTSSGEILTKLHVKGDEGVLFQGTIGNGTALNLGAGTRFHFYPKKSAIRGGNVDGTQWDDNNIGLYSIAFGKNTIALGSNSISIGDNTTASALGAVAIGESTTASATFSTAMGTFVSTNSKVGSFIIGDNSTSTIANSSASHQMTMRFAGGYRLFTNSALTAGLEIAAGGNSWAVISDSTKKEKFKKIDGESILNKISKFKLVSWNYKGQDPSKFRHYGPMAQDFYSAFGYDGIGTIGNDSTIASSDFNGINLIAIKALEKRTREQEERIKELERRMHKLEGLINNKKVTMTSK